MYGSHFCVKTRVPFISLMRVGILRAKNLTCITCQCCSFWRSVNFPLQFITIMTMKWVLCNCRYSSMFLYETR